MRGVTVGGVDFRDLTGDVGGEARWLWRLGEDGRRYGKERDDGEKVLHRLTIAELESVLQDWTFLE
jgi:hypothetical protein